MTADLLDFPAASSLIGMGLSMLSTMFPSFMTRIEGDMVCGSTRSVIESNARKVKGGAGDKQEMGTPRSIYAEAKDKSTRCTDAVGRSGRKRTRAEGPSRRSSTMGRAEFRR